ncbi:ATP-binding cassette domain-containing protein [Kosmotoga sp. DU53]|uniref:ATP-binding cassette domain-containing protein n=1 Tax=Kosmotoga sp. DU53 TaxID=1310160 RepID=UPI002101CDE6|nr:ATP-binding cassette domain-containing protein [Kosmotoga sp. DU53]
MEKTVERIEKIISIESISKEIKGRNILKNVSFDILRGEILALVGPNGAGKTTTVRCLSGIFNIDSGVINKMEGLDISVMPEKDFFLGKIHRMEEHKNMF